MTLYLMVSGSSEFEASRKPSKFTSPKHIDSPLSAEGVRQAELLGKRCRFMHVAAEAKIVVTSPLTRAIQTAGIALGSTNVVKRDFSFSDGFFGRAGGRAERGDGGISTSYVVCRHLAEAGVNVSNCGTQDVETLVSRAEPGVLAKQWNVDNLEDHWCDATLGNCDGLLPVVDFKKEQVVVLESKQQAMVRATAAWRFILALPEQRVAVVSHPVRS